MNSTRKAIGGYLELETKPQKNYHHQDLLHLNTARNSFEYVLRARKYTHVYIPYFTCDVLLEPLRKLNIEYTFYDVDNKLEPIFDYNLLRKNEGFLLTNYFGIKSDYIRSTALLIKNLIVDNSQALFDAPIDGVDTFYSPRKFIGVADGGYLSTTLHLDLVFDDDHSWDRMTHLLKRADLNAEAGYSDFKENDAALERQPIRKMSALTSKILKSVDYNSIREIRRRNFDYLHRHLKSSNKIAIDIDFDTIPMIYPYRISNAIQVKKRLFENKIFCATYWPNVFEWCNEKDNAYQLANEIIPLPLDQRYTRNEMIAVLNALT